MGRFSSWADQPASDESKKSKTHDSQAPRSLPTQGADAPDEDLDTYIVDNSELQNCNTRGIAYRRSPVQWDKHPCKIAEFHTIVRGVECEKGEWLRVGDLYLPTKVGSKTVLLRAWWDLNTGGDDLILEPKEEKRPEQRLEPAHEKPQGPAETRPLLPGTGALYEVVCDRAVVRWAPELGSPFFATRRRGQKLELFDWDDTRCWRRTNLNTGSGWVSLDSDELGAQMRPVGVAMSARPLQPLSQATREGCLQDVQRFLSEGLDPNHREADMWTPLMHAVCLPGWVGLTAALLLLEANADPSLATREGKTARQCAPNSAAGALVTLLELGATERGPESDRLLSAFDEIPDDEGMEAQDVPRRVQNLLRDADDQRQREAAMRAAAMAEAASNSKPARSSGKTAQTGYPSPRTRLPAAETGRGPMSLAQKAEIIRDQLGLRPGLALVGVVSQAIVQLGLIEDVKTLNIIQKVDLCLNVMGLIPTSGQTASHTAVEEETCPPEFTSESSTAEIPPQVAEPPSNVVFEAAADIGRAVGNIGDKQDGPLNGLSQDDDDELPQFQTRVDEKTARGIIFRVVQDSVTVYEEASPNAIELGMLGKGLMVEVLDYDRTRQWGRVEVFHPRTGYAEHGWVPLEDEELGQLLKPCK